MRRAVPVLLTAVLAAACTGQVGAGGPTQYTGAAPATGEVFPADDRDPAPAISGTTLDGKPLSLADLSGKVVVINFWASWCGPCRGEARFLNNVYAATKASGVEFVGIDMKDIRTSARAFQASKSVRYPSLFDEDGSLLLRFRGQAPQNPPSTMVLDRQGRVAARFPGPVTEAQLLAPVQVIAKEAG